MSNSNLDNLDAVNTTIRDIYTTDSIVTSSSFVAQKVKSDSQLTVKPFTYSGLFPGKDSIGWGVLTFRFTNHTVKAHTGITVYRPPKGRSIGQYTYLHKVLVRLSGGLSPYLAIQDEATRESPKDADPDGLTNQIIGRVYHKAINKPFLCRVEATATPLEFRLRDFWLQGCPPEPATYRPATRPFGE